MMRYLIIKLLFFVLLAYIQIVLAESNNEKCSEILGSIIVDTELTEQDKLNKWANYEQICSEDNYYYIGQALIYGLQDGSYAINYINKLIQEKKITYTKDILFFLGVGYDGIYLFQKDKEALKILLRFANILINDYKESATGFFLKGCYYFHKNDFDAAERYYKIAKDLGENNNDNFVQTFTIRGLTIKRAAIMFYRQNEFKFCIGAYKKALELDEFGTLADSFASNTVTRALIKIGNCSKAKELMEFRKTLFPQTIKEPDFFELEQEYSKACEK